MLPYPCFVSLTQQSRPSQKHSNFYQFICLQQLILLYFYIVKSNKSILSLRKSHLMFFVVNSLIDMQASLTSDKSLLRQKGTLAKTPSWLCLSFHSKATILSPMYGKISLLYWIFTDRKADFDYYHISNVHLCSLHALANLISKITQSIARR